jgi:hypothetical protein
MPVCVCKEKYELNKFFSFKNLEKSEDFSSFSCP